MKGYSWTGIYKFLELMKHRHEEGAYDSHESALFSMVELKTYVEGYIKKKDDKLGKVRAKMKDVVEQNIDNMDLVISRMKHIDTNVTAADSLKLTSTRFASKSKAVSNAAWWQHCRTYAIWYGTITCVVVIVLLLIIYEVDPSLFGGGASPSPSPSPSSSPSPSPTP